MDSINEDILGLKVDPEDMELDKPPPMLSLRDGKQGRGQAQPKVEKITTSDSPREGEIKRDIPLAEKQFSEAREPKAEQETSLRTSRSESEEYRVS